MMKRIVNIILILIMSLILSSCSAGRQIDDLGIVVTIALDMEEDEVILTSQIMSPQENHKKQENGASSDIKLVQSRGKTVYDALKNATLIYDEQLFLAHNSIIIFGEDLAKRGIGDMINFFSYDIGTRETAYLVVAKGAKGYEILGLPVSSHDYLLRLIENSHRTAKTRSMTLIEYLRYYYKHKTPVLGLVEIIEKPELNFDQKEKSPFLKVPNITGGAAFYKDKLRGYYSGEEMIGFNFIVDEIKSNPIVFATPDELTQGSQLFSTRDTYTTINILKSKTKLNIEIRDDEPFLNIDVDMKGAIVEETKGLNVLDKSVRKGIEDACSKQIKKYIVMAMDKAQKDFRMETFSIGSALHRQYPQVWKEVEKNWDEIFSDMAYSVNVKTRIIRTGVIDMPTNILRGRE